MRGNVWYLSDARGNLRLRLSLAAAEGVGWVSRHLSLLVRAVVNLSAGHLGGSLMQVFWTCEGVASADTASAVSLSRRLRAYRFHTYTA